MTPLVEFFTQGDYLIFLGIVFMVSGINFSIWGIVGILRYLTDIFAPFTHSKEQESEAIILPSEVAVIVPAHNEALVISDTIGSLLTLLPSNQIFVVSDGSTDKTVDIVRSFGVEVLDLMPSHGKAGALEEGIRHFRIAERFKAVILVDADTRLKHDYLEKALPYFKSPDVVAVAGYAQTMWNPDALSWKQMLFVLHRDRVYFLSQIFLKFAQTWKYTNVTHIVPGFASIYRTSVLSHITMNPPGLVIEDFNMTFEIHHKRLGRIAHHPSVVAYTQDPDNWNDYFRQIKRWHLGLWQTVRHHGLWAGKFWLSFSLVLLETVMSSAVFLLLPLIVTFWLLPDLLIQIGPLASMAWVESWYTFVHSWPILLWLFLGIWVADYVLTIIVALVQRRPEYLALGFGFPLIRFLDAFAFLIAIPRAFFVTSTGRWTSPTRRAV